MRSLILHWVLNAAALWAAAAIVRAWIQRRPGSPPLVAAVFGIVNSILRPYDDPHLPFIVITSASSPGDHALMLLVTGGSQRAGIRFTVMGFWAAFWGGLVVGLVSMVLSLLLPEKAVSPTRRLESLLQYGSLAESRNSS